MKNSIDGFIVPMSFMTSVSDKNMSKVLYAIFYTNASIIYSFNSSLRQYDRKQSSGFSVEVAIKIYEGRVAEFEELAGVKLYTYGKIPVVPKPQANINKKCVRPNP
jgi:hypothetical protein